MSNLIKSSIDLYYHHALYFLILITIVAYLLFYLIFPFSDNFSDFLIVFLWFKSIVLKSSHVIRQLQVVEPNYAPKLLVNPNLCTKPILLGRPHAGGWEICEDSLYIENSMESSMGSSLNSKYKDCIVYSYGLGADWSFDNEAEMKGCEVHGFDPTGKLWRDGMHGVDYSRIDYANQYPSKNKVFHNYGLGAASRTVYPKYSVPQLWPGLGDPQLSKTNTELWEMRSFAQAFVDNGHLEAEDDANMSNVIVKRITKILDSYDNKSFKGVNREQKNKKDDDIGRLQLRSRRENRNRENIDKEQNEHVNIKSEKSIESYIDTTFTPRFKIVKKITVLKVDVEGAEWDAFGEYLKAMIYMDAMVEVLKKGFIRQLLIEWHWDPDSRARNYRHNNILQRVEELGFKPWKTNRHEGSDCCLDMSTICVIVTFGLIHPGKERGTGILLFI